ncbi:sulfonate transport system ATP-binding protein [Paenibacillus shirakamiensis]|uniref:Sulfonate transport system ATP-binding protein n=1 Tax=Paenibacillus shirakamiensis TaxID=1265935 RepID=A0ABS4JNA4_9BACL|nr:ABC transporter ATP-binding protein [Paenibacillus shirakamiensis]MBP2002496.1 sulfonate transport system ATP-binding protein [Paenibacillus shirakamiensis]
MSAPSLIIDQLNRTFASPSGPVHALSQIQLTVKQGEFITLIGPSGCGKSTLLKIVAGLDTEFEGQVHLNGKPILGPGIEKGVIFQEPRLFPWLTVEQNIAANLSLKKPEIKQRVQELIALVRLQGFESSYPRELSGGMAQRVAIARALLRNPEVLLLDEPFGALDAFTRAHMQEVLLDIWQKNRTTMLFVTHDLDEAVFLGERVVIMNPRPGHIREILSIDLPFPRTRTGSSFQELRRLVLQAFEKVDGPAIDPGAGI